MVPSPRPFIVMMFSSLSGLSSLPENSTRRNSTWPLLSGGSVPPNGTPTRPSARHSPPGQFTGAEPLTLRPPQSPGAPLLASTCVELVIRMGWAAVPGALIFEPRRKISAETLVGPPPPGVGGFLPTTSASGSIVTVTPGWTKTRPSMSTRQPASHSWFVVMLPDTVTRLVQLSPPGPEPALGWQGLAPVPVQRAKRVGLPFRLAWRTTASSTPSPGIAGLTLPHDALPVPLQSAGFGTNSALWSRTASAIVRLPSPLRSPQICAPAVRA